MRIANLKGRLVLRREDAAIDVEAASDGLFGSDPQDVYERWDDFVRWAATYTGADGTKVHPHDLGAPVPRPRQVFAIGLNYADHASESSVDLPPEPSVFTKFPTSITGPHADVVLPTSTVDWEAELVVVIGRRAEHVSAASAREHIAGFTVGQDLSERTRQLLPPMPQFSLGKSYTGFAPIGPDVVTLDELDDPDQLEIGCAVNDEVMQAGNTRDLIFSVSTLIERLSAVTALLPGDLIFTGTPSGVGHVRDPRRYLAPGDRLRTWVTGVGEMVTTLHSPDESPAGE